MIITLDPQEVFTDVIDIMMEQVAHYPSDKECAKYISAILDSHLEIQQDVTDRLDMYMHDAIESMKHDLATALLNKITETQ